MRNPFRNRTDAKLDDQITKVLDEMDVFGVDSPEYPDHLKNLERLYELKTKTRPDPLSRDTIVMVIGNFGITLLIVAYEQKHVITSKALGMVGRTRPT